MPKNSFKHLIDCSFLRQRDWKTIAAILNEEVLLVSRDRAGNRTDDVDSPRDLCAI